MLIVFCLYTRVLKMPLCVLIVGLQCVIGFSCHMYSTFILTLNNILVQTILPDSKTVKFKA